MTELTSIEPRDDIEIEDYVFDDDWDTVIMKLGPLFVQFEASSISPSGSGGDESVPDSSDNKMTAANTHLNFIQANEILLTIEFEMKKYMTFHYSTMFKTLQILSLEEILSTPSKSTLSSTVTIKVRGIKLYFSEVAPDKIAVAKMLQKAIVAKTTTSDHNDEISSNYRYDEGGKIKITSVGIRDIRLQWGEKRYEYSTSATLDSLDNSLSASLSPTKSPASLYDHGVNSGKIGPNFDTSPNDNYHTNAMINGASFSTSICAIFAASLLASITLFFILQRQLQRNQRLQTLNDKNMQILQLRRFFSNSTQIRAGRKTALQEVGDRRDQLVLFGVGSGISQFPLKFLDLESESSYDHNATFVDDNEKCSIV